jgi:hypothetical protein
MRRGRVERGVARRGQVVCERARGARMPGCGAAAPRLAQRAHVGLQLADAAREAERGRPERVAALAAVAARFGVLMRRGVWSLQAAGSGQQAGGRSRRSAGAASVLACPGRCRSGAGVAAASSSCVVALSERPALRQSAAGRASCCTGEHARPVTVCGRLCQRRVQVRVLPSAAWRGCSTRRGKAARRCGRRGPAGDRGVTGQARVRQQPRCGHALALDRGAQVVLVCERRVQGREAAQAAHTAPSVPGGTAPGALYGYVRVHDAVRA